MSRSGEGTGGGAREGLAEAARGRVGVVAAGIASPLKVVWGKLAETPGANVAKSTLKTPGSFAWLDDNEERLCLGADSGEEESSLVKSGRGTGSVAG